VLIGPEGDFSSEEITQGKAAGFSEISLGENRLRTETAGIYVCNVFALI
jgi:16S rRNA (uracil1498-N3)-methyltransferase